MANKTELELEAMRSVCEALEGFTNEQINRILQSAWILLERKEGEVERG